VPVDTEEILGKNDCSNKNDEYFTRLSVDFLIGRVDYEEAHVCKVLNTVQVFHSVVEQETE
jgi:hypothetical protein